MFQPQVSQSDQAAEEILKLKMRPEWSHHACDLKQAQWGFQQPVPDADSVREERGRHSYNA